MHSNLEEALGTLDDKLLRAPGGDFASPPYEGYEGWYYYGWTRPQGNPEDSFFDSAADVVRRVKERLGENPPDNLVMLLHSNRPGTYEAIVNDQNDESIDLIKVFKGLGYTRFKKLPRPDDPTDIVIWP
jgi:hypothetical protein